MELNVTTARLPVAFVQLAPLAANVPAAELLCIKQQAPREFIYYIDNAAGDTTEQWRASGGTLMHKLAAYGERDIQIGFADDWQLHDDALQAFAEGLLLGHYTFTQYKKALAHPLQQASLFLQQDVSLDAAKRRAASVAWARDLCNIQPAELHPTAFAARIEQQFADTAVDVTLLDEAALEREELAAIVAVARGSQHPAYLAKLEYGAQTSKPHIVLIGKGVTFDTGGLNLKTGRDISDMKMDMGGAAAVVGAMSLLAALEADVHVTALVPIVENMPSEHALMPGEVIRYRNGYHVQVGNTDAEGRLILADALLYAESLQPDVIVDIATLTGAIGQALGLQYAGVFGDEELAATLKHVGQQAGDFVWPMPIIEAYETFLHSDYADFSNMSSSSMAGSITAALFLQKFVPANVRWAHIDMANVAHSAQQQGYYTKGATGFGVRLLADFVLHYTRGLTR